MTSEIQTNILFFIFILCLTGLGLWGWTMWKTSRLLAGMIYILVEQIHLLGVEVDVEKLRDQAVVMMAEGAKPSEQADKQKP